MLVVQGPNKVGVCSKTPVGQVTTALVPESRMLSVTGGLPVTVMEGLEPVTPLTVALMVALPL